jgi:hypothetical protein
MKKPTFAEQVYADAIAAGCDEDFARLLVVQIDDPKNAAAMATPTVATDLKKALLRNKAITTDAQRLGILKHAADVQALLSALGISASSRDIRNYIERDAAGNTSLMPLDKVRGRIIHAMAEADVHIDTSPPSDRVSSRSNTPFGSFADELWATIKAGREGVAK